MKKFFILTTCLSLLLCSGLLTSCIYDAESLDGCGAGNPAGGPQGRDISLSFKIRTVTNTRATGTDDREKVSYIRIIILNDGKLEANKLIPLPLTEASGLDYEYLFPSVEGVKDFYLIGNEQSVQNISFANSSLPAGLQQYIDANSNGGFSLSDLLMYYSMNEDGEFPDSEGEFESVINSVYFNPDYGPDANGNYYLPYTSHYGGYTLVRDEEDPTKVLDMGNFYMVPAATKFTFRFNNNREDNVTINGIIISAFNNEVSFNDIKDGALNGAPIDLGAICDNSYLFGQVDEEEETMSFDGTSLYWVDWLQKVANLTQQPSADIPSINERYGWIKNYDIPDASTLTDVSTVIKHFYPETPGEWLLYGTALDPSRTTIELGPYYIPESKHTEQYDYSYYDETLGKVVTVTLTRQAYYLSVDMVSDSGTKPDFTVVEINNLAALFRATSVVINIELHKGTYGVYAEIAPWTNTYSFGYVTERPDED